MDGKRNKRRAPQEHSRQNREQIVSRCNDRRAVPDGPVHHSNLAPVAASWAQNHYQIGVVCALLLLAVGMVFGQTVSNDFLNFDDNRYVYENPLVVHGLSMPSISRAFTQSCAANWVPLTWISFMVDFQLYGLNAGGYHLTNVLLHAATAMLLFLVLCRMTGRVWPSALAATLFAVHPLRVESVAWVAERKDVLSGLFFVLTLGAYVGYVRRPRFSLARYLAVMVFLALGLMAKPMLVTAPLLLLLLDYWPLERFAISPCRATPAQTPLHGNLGGGLRGHFRLFMRLVIEKLPLLALVAIGCMLTVWSQGQAFESSDHFSLGWRLGNAAVAYVGYLGQFFYPLGLAILYPRPALDLPLWRVLGAVLVLVAITAAAFLSRRRRPYLLIGWLWYLGMLAPVIGLLQVGTVTTADRFTYLPQIGLAMALAWGAADLCRSASYRRWLYGMASALVLVAMLGCAWRQTSFWHDRESLWSHTLACTSRNYVAHTNLGNALTDLRRFDEAIVQYQKALELRPDYADVHYNLGNVLAARGRLDEAMAHYQKAVELKPAHALAHANFGSVLANQGQFEEAMAHYRRVLELKPGHPDAHNNLARLRATCPEPARRNGDEAVALAKRASQLCGGRRPDYIETLAAAYAEAGRFPDALETARKALALAQQQNKQALADALRAQIAQYEAGKPYHEPLLAPARQPPKP